MSPLPTTLNQQAMEELAKLSLAVSDAVRACVEATAKVTEVFTAIEEHNLDAMSHPDIRTLLEGGGAASTDLVDERIRQHNESTTAHPEIVAKLESAIADMSKFVELISTSIGEHNESTTAHPDMKSRLNAIELEIGSVDLSDLYQTVLDLQTLISGTVTPAIVALQSVDANHDSRILINFNAIEELKTLFALLEAELEEIATGEFVRQKDMDDYYLKIQQLLISERMGLETYNPVGPNMMAFTTDMPMYVGRNSIIDFHMEGAVSSEGNEVVYSISNLGGDAQVAPVADIADSSPVTMTVGGDGNPRDQIYFVATATDKVTGASTQTLVNTMVATPLDVNRVSLYGLPYKVEPGNSYEFVIRNLYDISDGRYAYTIDPYGSELLFDKQLRLQNGDKVVLTVPTAVERNIEIPFQVIVHDKYNADQFKDVVVFTNPIPGAENFKHNIPQHGVPGREYQLRFSGIVSEQGFPANYNIINNNDDLTFSKTLNILPNENVLFTIANDVTRGEEYRFFVESIDNNGASVQIEVGTIINELPLSSAVVFNLPPETTGGQILSVFIDSTETYSEETGEVSFDIDPLTSGLKFNKTTGIKRGDAVEFYVPKVAKDHPSLFYIWITDAEGERAAAPYEAEILIKPIYIADAPRVTSPIEGDSVVVDFEMSWTGHAYHVDLD